MVLKKILIAIVAAALVYALALIEFPDEVLTYAPRLLPGKLVELLPPALPKPRKTTDAYWLDQNWRTEDRLWEHHATQGTQTFPIPYLWFVALEQPYLFLFGPAELLGDAAYLERLGFIPSPRTDATPEQLRAFGYHRAGGAEPPAIPPSTTIPWRPASNDDALPVGFARLTAADGKRGPEDAIGLTCAACHTGHIEYKGKTLRIDGGAATVDLGRLQTVVSLALAYTLKIPGRFDRFAERVVGPDASPAQKADLRGRIEAIGAAIIAANQKQGDIVNARKEKATSEGSGRLDALNRIGNQVFYTDMAESGLTNIGDNYHANDAPVRFPQIWTLPWFLWAQYDASIEHPLIRNAGEALGVAAALDLAGKDPKNIYRSGVVFENLFWIEDLLRGPDPFAVDTPAFRGLTAPKWPEEIFADDAAWKIDRAKADKGRALYAELCAGCHLGPVDDAEFDKAYPDKKFWTSNHWRDLGKGEKILAQPQKSAADIATDRARADVLATRLVQTTPAEAIAPERDINQRWACGTPLPAFPDGKMPFAYALMVVVDNVARKWMDDFKISDADRAAVIGQRKNCPNAATTPPPPFYRTRPLNGVWSVAPFLHNGSVPSLYWLLKPQADRPRKFCIGASDYDPRTVGYATPAGGTSDCKIGESLFSESDADGPIKGNGVGGHSFQDKEEAGRIGRALGEEEITSLIEYVKTL